MFLPVELASLLLVAVLPFAQAQTFSDCNPLEKTCAADSAMKSSKFTTDFKSASGLPKGWHTVPCKGNIDYSKGSADLVLKSQGDCPTIETDDYVFFGLFEVKMKASPGQGIISSIVMQSDVRDEVDWEFIGGENFRVQSNYFGKSDTTTYDRMVYVPVTDPQNVYHTYAVNWTSASITWLVDNVPVRTLKYEDAKGGTRFPQTPMRFRLGIWAGGDPSLNGKGTVDWAGGVVDYSKGPFGMYVDSVNVVNYSPADKYQYKDNSGSWQSIQVIGGTTGGIAPPGQNFAQSPSSTSGESTGTPIPVQPLQTDTTPATSAKGNGTITSAQAKPTAASNTTATTLKPAATTSSKTSATPSKATTNAASGFGAVREITGLSVLSAFFLVLFI